MPPDPTPFRRPEEELLCCCARTRWSPAVVDHVRTLVRGNIDWNVVVELAKRHRLRPLLLNALESMGLEAVPRPVLDQLKQARQALVVHNLLRSHELLRVLRRFREQGIEALAFKGPVLGQDAYGDVGLRPFGDLDLLLHRRDLLKAKAMLSSEGYRPDRVMDEAEEATYLNDQFAYGLVHEGRGVEIELHWALTHRRFAFRVDTEAVWDRSRTVTFGGEPVRTLGPEDLLVFLCVHGAKHEWKQLVWLCDVAELLRRNPGIDGARVLELARAARCERMLRLGLRLAHRWFGAPLPSRLGPLPERNPKGDRLERQVARHAFRLSARENRLLERLPFHVGVRDRWQDKASQVLEKLDDERRSVVQNVRLAVTPSNKDREFVTLPEGWGLMYYLIRPLRILHSLWKRTSGSDVLPHRNGQHDPGSTGSSPGGRML